MPEHGSLMHIFQFQKENILSFKNCGTSKYALYHFNIVGNWKVNAKI